MEQPKNNFKIVSDKKARMLLPNALTLINVCIGLSSIKFALDAKFELSIIAIIFAAIFDALDGRVARMLKGTSLVGKELDSLADLISFGVAPAFIMYFWLSLIHSDAADDLHCVDLGGRRSIKKKKKKPQSIGAQHTYMVERTSVRTNSCTSDFNLRGEIAH